MDYDILCVQDDPGANKIKALGNIYREIIGRKAGMEMCEKPYTLIIRSDSEILNLNFIHAFERNIQHGKYKEFRWLDKRVIMCSAGWTASSLFFLNDWFFFGKTEDVRNLYDLPVVDEDFVTDEMKQMPEYHSPHEYFAVMFCKKHIELNYTFQKFYDAKYRDMWEKILVENFMMIGFYEDYGISNLKEPYYTNQIRNSKKFINGMMHLMMNYEYEDWYKAYNKLYSDSIKTKKRFKWEAARIAIKLYRIIKPMHVYKK